MYLKVKKNSLEEEEPALVIEPALVDRMNMLMSGQTLSENKPENK